MRSFRLATHSAILLLAALASPSKALAVDSAELYSSASYRYGRFEARVRFAAGDGVVSSFFLWKNGSEMSGTFWNELDFEKVGADCHLETNAFFGSPAVPHSKRQTLSSDLCADFHTYAYEWTPEYIAWFVDDVEVRREVDATATAFADNASAGMQIRFNIWPGDASFGGNFSPAILPVRESIDWVQYSSYADGAFTLAWREEFDGSTLPSGWLTGSWSSPKNLSTHRPENVQLVDSNAVLLLSASASGGTSGTGGAASNTAGAAGAPVCNSGGSDGCSFSRLPASSGSPMVLVALAFGAACVRRRRSPV